MERAVDVALDNFSLALLEEAARRGDGIAATLLTRAIRYYLAERDSGRPGWPCSRSLSETGEVSKVDIRIDDSTWSAFSREAERQGTSTDQLVEHAVLYYLADDDSGRLAEKIVEDLDEPA